MSATTVHAGPRSLVVVGASLAGLRAVEAARKAGFAGRITLIGDEPHLPYDRPPLSKQMPAYRRKGRDSHDRIASTRHDGRRPHDLTLRHGAHP